MSRQTPVLYQSQLPHPLQALLRSSMLVVMLIGVQPVAGQSAAIPTPDLSNSEERVRQAIAQYSQVVAAKPESGASWGRLGMVFEAHGHFESAKTCYQEAARLEPEEFRWAYFLAGLFDYRDAELALAWHQKALAIDPLYAPARVRAAEALEKLGRASEAQAQFEKAIELDGSIALAHLGAGRLLLRAGQTEAAVRQLERAYELSASSQAVVATLARAYHRAGRTDLAKERAQEARTLSRTRSAFDPIRAEIRDMAADLESYLRRARTAIEVGRNDEAAAEISRLLTIEPDHAEAYLMLATIENRRQRLAESATAARRALEIDSSLEDRARPVLAGALFKLGRTSEAAPQVAQVLKLQPGNFHMLLLATMLAGERGDVGTMVEMLDRAWQARSGESELRQVLGGVLRDVAEAFADAGQSAEAATWFERVVQLAVEDRAPESVVSGYRARLEELRSQ